MLTLRALILLGALLTVAGRAWGADWESVKDAPAHLQLAVQAAALKIAGNQPGKLPVNFSPAALGAVQRLAVKPVGFTLVRTVLYGVSMTKKGRVPRYAASGALAYLSPLGQRAVVAFTVLYALRPHGLRIEFASFAPVVSQKPIVMMYLLPGSISERDLLPANPRLEMLLGQIAEHAYDVHKPSELTDGEYLLAGVVFDWLPDPIPVNLWISDKPDGIDPPLGPATPANFGGWRVYLRRVTLKFTEHPKYYAKFGWTRGADSLMASEPIPAGRATGADFDGNWSITQVCPPVGDTLGYAFNFAVQVSGGLFHTEEGVKGQPGSWSLEGKIAPDGAVAIRVNGLISADKKHIAGNARPGTPFVFDVEGRIIDDRGTGKRKSARHCDWTFVKQATGQVTDISGPWSTTDGRIVAVKQNGNRVTWRSCCRPGHEDLVVTVSGTFDGKTLNGTYLYREGQTEGSGIATYTLNGDRLEGRWQMPDGKNFGAALIRARGEAPANLAGKWTTVSGRTVALTQTGNQVTWTTCCLHSHPNWTADISATFDGKNLVGTFHWKDGDKQGNGTAAYVLNGNQLEGEIDMPGRSEPYRSMLTRQTEGSLAGKWTTPRAARSP